MYSSQSPWCSGQPELKHELLLQTHPANNHPEANRKRSPAQTLELQFLSSTLKSFWRGVSQCLWVPPAPGKSAVMGLAGWLPRALHPFPPPPSRSVVSLHLGHPPPASPQGPPGLLFITVCSTVISRLEIVREALHRETWPRDKSRTVNNSCYSQSSTHRKEKKRRKGG